jgi:hypothetical protein
VIQVSRNRSFPADAALGVPLLDYHRRRHASQLWSAEYFGNFINAEIERWAKVIKDAGVETTK